MHKLTEVQRAVLSEVASGAELRWEQGVGLRVGNRRVRPTTVCALCEAMYLAVVPYAPDADRIDYAITEFGYRALGITLEAAGPGATEGMVLMETVDRAVAMLGVDKPIESHMYILGLGLISLPEMAAEDQANLLAMLRKRVPDFGHRAGGLESGIVDLGDHAVMVLAAPDEPTYMALFCEDVATALALITVYAAEEEMDVEESRYFDRSGVEHPLDLGEALG